MNTFLLTQRVRNIATLLLDAEEITPEMSALLDQTGEEVETKVRTNVAIRLEWEAEAKALREMAKRLTDQAKRRESRAEWVERETMTLMEAAGIGKLKTDLGTVSVGLSSRPAIRWEGSGDFPDEFARVKRELDGNAAYDAYRAGTLPEGFTAERSKFLKVM